MKKYILPFFFLLSLTLSAQVDEDFCKSYDDSSYYTLMDRKKVVWGSTYYIEVYSGEAEINGVTYYKYKQEWEKGKSDYYYVREDDGRIYQYEECCGTETLKYDEFFDAGQKWTNADGSIKYTLLSYNESLVTPFCSYSGLMGIQAEYKTGTYVFYYQQGNGYVGGTLNGTIMSCISPQ